MKNNLTILFVFFFSVQLIAQTDSNYANGEKIPCEEIIIGCRVLGGKNEYVIKNETEYHAFLQSKQSSLLKCTGNEWPVIDFTKFTLLGITVGVAGCKEPLSEHTVYYQSKQSFYVFELIVTQQGFCKMLNNVDIWCLIPQITENATVEFKVIEKS